MEDNNLNTIKKVVSLYVKDLVLYFNPDVLSHDMFGYIYKNGIPIAIVIIPMKKDNPFNTKTAFGIDRSIIRSVVDLLGVSLLEKDFNDEPNMKVIQDVLSEIFKDRINKYYLEKNGYDPITEVNGILYDVEEISEKQRDKWRRINLY